MYRFLFHYFAALFARTKIIAYFNTDLGLLCSLMLGSIVGSTLFTTMLTYLVDKTWLSYVYTWISRITSLGKVRPEAVQTALPDKTETPRPDLPVT